MKWITDNLRAVLAVVALVVIILLGLQVRSCQQARQQAAQSKVDRGQGEAFKGSAEDAINVQSAVNANDQATADLDRQNRREITDAEGADDSVNPAVDAAARRSLCRRAAYRNRSECRVQQPNP